MVHCIAAAKSLPDVRTIVRPRERIQVPRAILGECPSSKSWAIELE